MADRTTDAFYETRPNSGRDSFVIANTVTLAAGTLVQMEGGYANHWDETGSTDIFMGIAIGGDDSASTDGTWLGDTSGPPAPDPEVHIDTSGVTMVGVTLAGTVTQAKVGITFVYCADSDPDNMTLNASGKTYAIGILYRFLTSTTGDVKLFTPQEYIAYNFESPGS